ncbi:leucine-rich repeat protein [Eubacterium oxidoreducens]|uniref:Lactocepin n=1 Tax=Eubacterium oxidoreducens TaxID=1732 RepID=A0A1G6A2Y2_EUBOX|nr:leucine-rich repeat protein [Eubacterium oxidoreducens]SDB02789.1 lactocepin [Eubacterium oxidoreducens]
MKKKCIAIFMAALVIGSGNLETVKASEAGTSDTETSEAEASEEETSTSDEGLTVQDVTEEGEARASTNIAEILEGNADLLTADLVDEEDGYEPTDQVTVIVELNGDAVESTDMTFFQSLVKNYEHKRVKNKIEKLVSEDTEESDAELYDDSQEESDEVVFDVRYDYFHVMNGFAVEVEYQYVDDIRALSGVKNAFVEDVHYLEDTTSSDTTYQNESSLEMVGADSTDLTGEGQVIAIIDSGVDINHEAFSGEISNASMTEEDVSEVLDNLNAKESLDSIKADDVYHNEKFPYTFDYADNDADAIPGTTVDLSHGTHVAGIAAANGGDEIVGVAPDAQIVVMKAFTDSTGAGYDSVIIAAVEDAYVLGVDSINMSLGADVGFSTYSEETYERIYENVGNAGISLNVAAGNAYSQSYYGAQDGTGLASVNNPDNGMVATPSTESTALSVASSNNVGCGYYFLAAGDQQIKYREATISDGTKTYLKTVNDTQEYVDCGQGSESDIEKAGDLTGKYALIQRGGTDEDGNNLTFEAKANNAAAAGAEGIIVYNNVESDSLVDMGGITQTFVSVFISKEDGEALLKAEDKTFTASADYTYQQNITMSDFSSWGVTPDLKLKPEITAPGGSIYSSVPGDSYSTMSGTSMATPQVTGLTALVRQYVETSDTFEGYSDTEKNNLISNLLMCTATPLTQSSGGTYYSPRQQGAGKANIQNVENAKAYITVDGADDAKPKAELGDDENGEYTIRFTVHNLTDENLSYTLDTSALSEAIENEHFTQSDIDYAGNGIDISYSGLEEDGTTLKVAGGKSAEVQVTIKAEDSFKEAVKEAVNGTFIEGFVQLKAQDESGSDLSFPYLGFYGDWSSEDIIENSLGDEDTTYYYKQSAVYSGSNSYYYLGQNIFTGSYNADRYAISKDSLAQIFTSLTTVTGLLRSAAKMTYEVTDADGNVVWNKEYEDIRKSYYSTTYATMLYAEAFMDETPVFEGKDNDGNKVADGTYTMTITATGCGDDDDEDPKTDTWTFDFEYDTQDPVVKNVEITETDSGKKQLHITFSDNHYLTAAQLTTSNGSLLKTIYFESPSNETADANEYDYYFDYDELLEDLEGVDGARTDVIYVDVYDYAVNYSESKVVIQDTYPESVELNETDLTLTKGQEKQLTATLSPEEVTKDGITWTSSDESVATVSEDGLVTAVSSGTATITAQTEADGVVATCEVTVTEVSESQGLLLSRDSVEVLMGETVELHAILSPSLEGSTISWESSDETLATVDENGVVTAVSTGEVTVTASVTKSGKTYSDSCAVIVRPENYDDFTIDENGVLTSYDGWETDVEIPEGVTEIGEYAFYARPVISVNIPSSVVTIGYHAFDNCQKLTSVTFSENSKLYTIGEGAFNYCICLSSIDIPSSVRELSSLMFYYDPITSITIPEGVTSIPDYAFYNTGALKDIQLPDSLKTIGSYAFAACGVEEITIPENVKSIGDHGFGGSSLRSFTCPDSLRTIGAGAFMEDTSLETIRLNEGLTSIGEAAFSSTGLVSLTIPDSVTYVGPSLVVSSSSLESVHIGANLEDLETPFAADYSLKTITVSEDNQNLTVGEDGVLYSADYTRLIGVPYLQAEIVENNSFTLLSSVTTIEAQAFYNMTNLQHVLYENDCSLTTIKSQAFYLSGLVEVVLPDSVKKIGNHTFANCFSVTKVDLNHTETLGKYAFSNILVQPDFGDFLKEIGEYAFASDTSYYQKAMTDVTLPDTVETIGDAAFINLQSITNVSLGSKVKEIGVNVFTGNNYISTITVDEDNKYFRAADNVLYSADNSRLLLYAPAKTTATYTAPEGVTTIDPFAFRNATKMKKAIFGEGLTTINISAFNGCSSLAEVEFPKELTTIGAFAFMSTAITSLTLEGDIATIEDNALSFMTSLEHLVIKSGNDTVVGNTYYNSAKTMYFGDGVKSITGSIATSSLKKVVLSDTVKNIDDSAFTNATSVTFYAQEDSDAYALAEEQVSAIKTKKGSAEIKTYTPMSLTVKISQPTASSTTKVTAKAVGGIGTKEYRFVSVDEDGNETLLQDYSGENTYTASVDEAGTTIRAYARDTTYCDLYEDLRISLGDVMETGDYVASASLTDSEDAQTNVLTDSYDGAVAFTVGEKESKIYLPLENVSKVVVDGKRVATDKNGYFIIPATSLTEGILITVTTEDNDTVKAMLTVDTTTIAIAADKSELEELLDTANDCVSDDYTTATYRPFYTARKAAQKVYNDILANQTEVNEAYDDLLEAYEALEIELVEGRTYSTNVTLVTDAAGSNTSMANSMLREKALVTYNEDHTWTLDIYFAPGEIYGYSVNGQNVDGVEYIDTTNTQVYADMVKDASARGIRVFEMNISSLETFIMNLHYHYTNSTSTYSLDNTVYLSFDDTSAMKVVRYEGEEAVDTDELDALLNEAVEYAEDDYTQESYDALQEEIDAVEAALDDDKITETEVKTALSKLQKAIEQLVSCANTPKISSLDGASNKVFDGSKEIRITTATKNATIYYTLDGTEPTTDSQIYTKAFTLKESAIVRAIAVADGMESSREISAEYICLSDTSLLSKTVSVDYYGYEICVTLKVFNGEIADIDLEYTGTTTSENKGYMSTAFSKLKSTYVGMDVSEAAQADVDTVSGATYSSNAFTQAVKAAAADYVAVEGLQMKESELALSKGSEGTVVPVTTPANATEQKFTYASDNEEVATVTSQGVVTALSKGTANITVITKDGKYQAVTKVTVTEDSESSESEENGSDENKTPEDKDKPASEENSGSTTSGEAKTNTSSGTSKIAKGYKKTINGIKYQVISSNRVQVLGASSKKVKSVSIPATVKIGSKSYKVTGIASKAFMNYKNLTRVKLSGKYLTTIGEKAFYKDKKLKSLTIASASLTSKSIGKKAFAKTSKKMKVKVPSSKVKAYRKYLRKAGLSKKAKVHS